MKKRVFLTIFLLFCLIGTFHISIAAAAPNLDLQTLIAGIKHFDAAATSGTGQENKAYTFTLEGATFEDAKVKFCLL